MQQIDHINVLKVIEFGEGPYTKKDGSVHNVVYMVSEFLQNGSLFDFIKTYGFFPEPVARYYFLQLLDGL